MTGLKAAAATVEIKVSDLPAAAGRRQEAPLRASVLLVDADPSVCIVSCDVIGLMKDTADEIATEIGRVCGVPVDHVLVTATHTHHAPRPMPVYTTPRIEELCRRLVAASIDAARKAQTAMHAAGNSHDAGTVEMLFAMGQEATVGENSRWLMRDGQISWWKHDESEMIRPTGPHDPDVPVVAFRDITGRLVGAFFCHGTHNIGTLDPEPATVISPGFFGLAAQELEKQHKAPFLFLPGAFGSSHRRNGLVAPPEALTRVVNAVNETLARLQPVTAGPVCALKRPYTCRYRQFDEAKEAAEVSKWCRRWLNDDEARGLEQTYAAVRQQMADSAGKTFETWLQVIRLGDVVLMGIPGEMFAALGLEIRRRSPFRNTFVLGLANDEIGYIADRRGYEDGGYQTWFCGHSQLEPGEGERMVEAALALLQDVT